LAPAATKVKFRGRAKARSWTGGALPSAGFLAHFAASTDGGFKGRLDEADEAFVMVEDIEALTGHAAGAGDALGKLIGRLA
jgi:hypothetical protein